jgi:Na+/citrate or Na+/malate symporter
VVLQDANGYTELRSMYIGLMASLGLFFLLALLLKSWRVPALALALISYTALALVRAWGLYAEELGNALMQQLLLTEIVSALLAVLALYCQQLNARRPVNPYR